MGKTLFIFDDSLDTGALGECRGDHSDILVLFPLASDWALVKAVEEAVAGGTARGAVGLLDSARLINEEVDRISRRVAEWSSGLSETPVWGRPVKEWFTVGRGISTWWFSMVSEKNTLKTDAFFKTAQINAIDRLLGSEEHSSCRFAISDRTLRKAVTEVCRRHGVGFERVETMRMVVRRGVKGRLLQFLSRAGFAGDLVYSVGLLLRDALRGVSVRRAMKGLERKTGGGKGLLFVSYFPLVDSEAAQRGIFRNGYCVALQERLKEIGLPVSWLFMYVSIGSYSFRDALRMARNFSANGEKIFFMEEFITPGAAARVFLLWALQVARYLVAAPLMRPSRLPSGLGVAESRHFLHPLWRKSFVGKQGMEGIVYFELFKRAFGYFKGVSHCVYYAEMHAWEKALNSAKKAGGGNTRVVGFQHASLPRNFFHYFHGIGEMPKGGGPSELPLPDVLACNGDIPMEMMGRQGYPNLLKVEAIRQLYLRRCFGRGAPNAPPGEPVLLVAGSIDRKETGALVGLAAAAFGSGNPPFRVWLKGHPSLPIGEVCSILGIDPSEKGFEVKDGPVDRLLEVSTAVMVGASTVALEALAFGKEVIVPVFSDQMFMSPLAGFESLYHMVYSPGELVSAVERIFKAKEKRNMNPEGFISRYWNLDDSLRGWGEVLGF